MKQNQRLYKDLAIYYDIVFKDRDYSREAQFIKQIVKERKLGNELLDIGCGTGQHDELLKNDFRITGIDPNKQILDIAVNKNSSVNYYQMSMADFKLPQKFDVAVSLFGVIHYAKDYVELRKNFKNVYNHLKRRGLFIFDVSLRKDAFKNHNEFIGVNKEDLSVNMIKNTYKLDPNHANTLLTFFIKDALGSRKEYDEHVQLIIDIQKTKSMLESTGFRVKLYDGDFSLKTFTEKSKMPLFVCVKK